MGTQFNKRLVLHLGASAQVTISPDASSDTTTLKNGGIFIGTVPKATLTRNAIHLLLTKPLVLIDVTE